MCVGSPWLSFALMLPDLLLILGSIRTFAALAAKRLQGFPRRGNYVSTVWKNRVRKVKYFPHNGKPFSDFSTQWKIGECRAQVRRTPGEREIYSDRQPGEPASHRERSGKLSEKVPRCGNIFSTVWKNRVHKAIFFPRNGKSFSDFSTQWNNFAENFPQRGKAGYGALPGAQSVPFPSPHRGKTTTL